MCQHESRITNEDLDIAATRSAEPWKSSKADHQGSAGASPSLFCSWLCLKRSPEIMSHASCTLRCILLLALGCWSAGIKAGTLAIFDTPLGAIDVELFEREKPVTVGNFTRYVKGGRYEKMFFHRWVPGFVVQGGGFFAETRSGSSVIEAIPLFEVITNEFTSAAAFRNTFGTLAMARVSGRTNSATSQWFFNLGDNRFLDSVDGGFTVFGRVLRGTNVLNRFNNASATNQIFRLKLASPLDELPVLSATPTLDDLVYVKIRLLEISLSVNQEGAREISWASVNQRTNVVEFASNWPPQWQVLHRTNGHGGRMHLIDREPGLARFYRIRVDYP